MFYGIEFDTSFPDTNYTITVSMVTSNLTEISCSWVEVWVEAIDWHSVKVSLSAEEMEAERERKRSL